MKKSDFQFTNPILKELVFESNDDFKANGETSIEINISPEISSIHAEDSESFATVCLCLTLGEKNSSAPFFIRAVEEANFKWENEQFTPELVEKLLNQNAVSLLISYLRPIIVSVTASSKFPAYNLPYLNLTSIDADK